MSLVVEAHKSLVRIRVHVASNAFIVHLPTYLSGQDKVLRYVEQAQTRLEQPSLHRRKSLLDGQLVAVKDNIWTSQFPTTCASGILQGFQSPLAANVVNALETAGMVIVGKTNMDEFGMGSHSRNSYYGPVKNDAVAGMQRTAGGSSGGSAMAVRNRQCRVALGTDTGGSVRLPAAYTGLIGFKPSYGRLSRYGVVPYANSLDTVGIIGSDCEDIVRIFEKMNRSDINDPTCLNDRTRKRILEVKRTRLIKRPRSPVRVVRSTAELPAEKPSLSYRRRQYPKLMVVSDWSRTIGVPAEYNIEEMSDVVREAWIRTLSQLETQGHTIVPISLPHTKAALSAYYVLAPAEASSNLAKYDGVRYGCGTEANPDDKDTHENNDGSMQDENTVEDSGVRFSHIRGKGFGAEVQRRILLGTYSLSSAAKDNYFIQAQKVRRLVQRDFDNVFKLVNPLHSHSPPPENGVDYIICPTAPTAPPRIQDLQNDSPPPLSQRKKTQDSFSPSPSTIVSTYTTDLFTVPASLAGIPAVSVPAPLGLYSQDPEHRNIGIQVLAQYGDDMGLLKFVQQQLEPDKHEVSHYARELGAGKKKYL